MSEWASGKKFNDSGALSAETFSKLYRSLRLPRNFVNVKTFDGFDEGFIKPVRGESVNTESEANNMLKGA